MNAILLSGGSGKRLWPLSNDIRSKQFIKFFKADDGSHLSMIQRVYNQIKKVDQDAMVTIATSKTQVSSIHNQLGSDGAGISIEPCRRDTFPAIALATAYLHDVQHISEEESVVVCPVDPYVGDDYFTALDKLCRRAAESDANLVLMGIEPTYPSEKYGYIIPENAAELSKVQTFKEKPDEATAREYIEQGALWNGGVFAYKLKYVLDIARELLNYTTYQDLYNRYAALPKISFDYAVVEKEQRIEVMRFRGEWKDLGTWNTLVDSMSEDVIGEGMMDETCERVHIINELDMPILAMGMKDTVIAASPQGILVSSTDRSAHIKPFVEKIDQRIMFAEKSWGVFRVIDVEENSITIKATIKAKDHMNYHSHEHRDEVWNIVSGTGTAIVDDTEREVGPGDVITMKAGQKHMIVAETDLVLIEVQVGKDISVKDKQKFEMKFL